MANTSHTYAPPDGGGGSVAHVTSMSQPPTYANQVKQNSTNQPTKTIQNQHQPKKEQAIIINAMNDIPLKEYVITIGEIVNPINITHVSRLSNQRICIFLKNKAIVEQLVTEHQKISVQNHITELRRYVTPPTRVIISNICPSIPDEEILKVFRNLNIKTISSISFHRAGMQDPAYAHIMSFRRQVYIPEADKSKVPETIIINHENTDHRIFFTTDTQICKKCNALGHLENKCKNTNITDNQPKENTPQTSSNNTQTNNTHPKETIEPIQNTQNNYELLTEPPILTPEPQQKRSAPSTSSDNELNEDLDQGKDLGNDIQNKKKKKKTQYEDSLQMAKTEIESNPNKYILDYYQLKDFLENALSPNHPKDILEDYTDNEEEVLSMLEELHSKIEGHQIKTRLARIIKKLKLTKTKEINQKYHKKYPHTEGAFSSTYLNSSLESLCTQENHETPRTSRKQNQKHP